MKNQHQQDDNKKLEDLECTEYWWTCSNETNSWIRAEQVLAAQKTHKYIRLKYYCNVRNKVVHHEYSNVK